MSIGKLIFVCGKMGSGKTTHSIEIAKKRNAVLLSEDEWLASLYPGKILSLSDYVKYSNRLKPQIKKLTQSILTAGLDVVLDFPANTITQREWLKGIYSEINANHELLYIDITDEICLKQIEKRRIQNPERASTDTKELFEEVTKYFTEPQPAEGFNIIQVSLK